MTERTQEQLDMIYEPLQQKLREQYQTYRTDQAESETFSVSYLNWLQDELRYTNFQITDFKEQ